MSASLTNEEIRQKLLKLNYDCGPVTDTTREVLLKKLLSLSGKYSPEKKQSALITDEELRSQLISYGVSVAPITDTNRAVYLRRLQTLKKSNRNCNKNNNNNNVEEETRESEEDVDEWEPMEID